MAGTDGGHGQLEISPLRDATRWAASFVALLFTGDAPAQLPAEEDAINGGGGCNSLYRSVSTVEEDVERDAADESEEQLLAGDEGEDPRRTRSVSEHRLISHSVHTTRNPHQLRRRHSTGAALRSGDAWMKAAESEPMMFRRRAAKRANEDVVETTIDHAFGYGRREQSSSLPLLSS